MLANLGSNYWFGYWVLGFSIQNFEKRNQNWNQNYELKKNETNN